MEAADPSVSIDLLVRVLLSLGAARKDLAKAVSGGA
jgi:chemotaxis receptor (MCP) glutamine deamidase CheD